MGSVTVPEEGEEGPPQRPRVWFYCLLFVGVVGLLILTAWQVRKHIGRRDTPKLSDEQSVAIKDEVKERTAPAKTNKKEVAKEKNIVPKKLPLWIAREEEEDAPQVTFDQKPEKQSRKDLQLLIGKIFAEIPENAVPSPQGMVDVIVKARWDRWVKEHLLGKEIELLTQIVQVQVRGNPGRIQPNAVRLPKDPKSDGNLTFLVGLTLQPYMELDPKVKIGPHLFTLNLGRSFKSYLADDITAERMKKNLPDQFCKLWGTISGVSLSGSTLLVTLKDCKLTLPDMSQKSEDNPRLGKIDLPPLRKKEPDLSSEENEVLAPLIRNLQAKDAKVRIAAIRELAALGSDAKDAGAALVEFGMMDDKADAVREAAFAAFEKIDPTVYKPLITLLIDENEFNKYQAIYSLQLMGKKAKATVPAIKARYLFKRRDNQLDYASMNALVAIAPEDTSIQSAILELVGDNDSITTNRHVFIQWMNAVKVTNKQKFKALMSCFQVTKRDQVLIIKELGKLGADAKEALPILMKLKFDPNSQIRMAAEDAVLAING